MKNLLVGILLFSLWQPLFAKEIDVTSSKGIDQSVIVSLTPAPASMDADQDVVLKAVFNVELDESSVQKNNVKLKKITSTKETLINGNVAYDLSENAVTFTPSTVLGYGYYEVEFKSLKAVKSQKNQLIKEIKYRFYVAEVVNGYKLPPKPDKTLNNSTLLGIDVNKNGIRDDVERYIIKRYASDPKYSKTKTAIALQYAWASQKILENPTIESSAFEDDALACESYWFEIKTKNMSGFEAVQYSIKHGVFGDPELKDKIYNTKERITQKFSYNGALSGHILEDRKENTIDRCRININEFGE